MQVFSIDSSGIRALVIFLAVTGLVLATPVFGEQSSPPHFSVDGEFKAKVSLSQESDLERRNPRIDQGRKLKTAKQHPSSFRALTHAADRLSTIRKAIRTEAEGNGPLKALLSPSQRRSLHRLAQDHSDASAIKMVFDPQNGTPTFVKLKTFHKGHRPDERALLKTGNAAEAFINLNRDLLKLDNPQKELVLQRAWFDRLGAGHYKYQQVVDGIPVFGKQLLIHLDSTDAVYLVNGRYEPTPESLDTTARITEAQALSAALNHLGMKDRVISADAVDQVIYTLKDGRMVLTYRLKIPVSLSRRWVYFIDAHTGQFVHRMTDIHSDVVNAGGVDLNAASQSFKAWQQDNAYFLIDPSMPSASLPTDPVSSIQSPGNTYILSANNQDGENLYHISSTAPDSGWDAAGVSAMANIRATYEYYHNTFGRNGIDDNDKNYMAVVHMESNYNNAFWNGTFVVFGDGDNKVFSSLAAALDITAHEIQHGITQFTADLKYENQSGALNEAYSDLFACMVDDDDWLMGEDCTVADPGYLRNLAEPAKGLSALPATMSDYRNLPNTEDGDWGGVHVNMSIPSRAGYLMAEGLDAAGPAKSIGRAKTAKIWYRALTTYLSAYAQFVDGRRATLQAAEDLYGADSEAVAAVQAAWDAVEVFDSAGGDADKPEPTPGDTVSGDDVLIYLYPVDHTHDHPYDPSEHYDLYVLLDADNGYVIEKDIGPLNDTEANINRPHYTKAAAYTSSTGNTIIFYATEDYDLHSALLYSDGTADIGEEVLDSKDIYSIALSPDGRYFAYTTPFLDDDHIYVLDLDENRVGTIALTPPNDTEDGSDVFDTFLYADALAFDFSGKVLVFDALNCISTPDSRCQDGAGYRYWSIGFVYLENDPNDSQNVKGTLAYPFPNQDPDVDISYPAFAANNSYVLAVDVIDHQQTPTISSMVWTLNGLDGQNRQVADPNRGDNDRGIYGTPTFWASDQAVTIQRLSNTSGSAYRVPLDDNWAGPADSSFQGSQGNIASINDYDAAMPVMHRRSARQVAGNISFSTQQLIFSNVTVNSVARKDLTLSNNSARDIRIENISLSGADAFRHNGINGLLPRKGQMVITVTYEPTNEGSDSATLTIVSDADTPTTQIALSGKTSGAADDGASSGSSGGGGGGCLIDTIRSIQNQRIAGIRWSALMAVVSVLAGDCLRRGRKR